MTVMYYMYMYRKNNIHFKFICIYLGDRAPQNLMTTVPEKVWPNAMIPYKLDANISE